MVKTKTKIVTAPTDLKKQKTSQKYSVEFFHIYTDEKINGRHKNSLRYLQEAMNAWSFDYDLFVLIDDYNPTEHVTSSKDVLEFLTKNDVQPNFWAFESAFIENAEILLASIEKEKIRNQYRKYIEKKGKYPCSLLAASWYLTRLGRLPHTGQMNASKESSVFVPADRLVNILPDDFRTVELRVQSLIANSKFREDADRIQDLFYPATVDHEHLDLF